jgi:2-oxoglutarate ferredoxin oxidoreductase subunit alpha
MLGTEGKEFATERALRAAVERHDEIVRAEARAEALGCEGAETVVVAFGMPSRFARAAAMREGTGFFRPITLWPFPSEQLRAACASASRVLVYEINNGQMIDDVRLAVEGRVPVEFIGGISTDRSGFGVGDLLDVNVVRERITA